METIEGSLHVIEMFQSIQGETSLTGLPTTFLRLAACNLRCTWCDTTYSFGRGNLQSLKAIFHQIEDYGHRHVCITGGEPLLQRHTLSLMTHLCHHGYVVSLETGGSLSTKEVDPRVIVILDIKCPGSGMSKRNHWNNLNNLKEHDEVKFVLKNEEDYLYAKAVCKKYSLFDRNKEVLFSPVHEEMDPQELIALILKDSIPVRLNLQIHKYVWSSETQGV
ncbi:MAG: radical SAM protein [Waddliaceae bacterium]